VSARDVDTALRRVNRRIETGIVAMPATARCLETTWDHPTGLYERNEKTKSTLVFLHGFGDRPEHWREFAELLVRGTPGGCDIVLPGAPARPFLVGGAPKDVAAWFEPRLNHRSGGGSRSDAETTDGGSIYPIEPIDPLETTERASISTERFTTRSGGGCGGIEPAVRWIDCLLRDLERAGAEPGSVVLAGFSQGAALALSCAAAETAWRPALGGVLCFRGYLPRRVSVVVAEAATEKERYGAITVRPPAVLLCQGGKDEVAPTAWARAAADRARDAREALGTRAEVRRVELTVCEDRGHELGEDDVWRARWWIRSRFERAFEELKGVA